jgi:hypothetical protein
MELKEHIQIPERIKNGFEKHKKSLLFSHQQNWFVLINDFKIEEKTVVKKNWSLFGGTTTTSTQYFLTDATILVWNSERKSWAGLTESGINILLSYDDPESMRKYYIDRIKSPLESLGVKFNINDK